MAEFMSIAKEWSVEAMVFRMASALLMGLVIGVDRGIKRRGAGVKTHVLVCLGAALVMMTGEYIYLNFEGNMDISRIGAQVISGVGFLGVGTIIVTGKNQVRGLTTAAGLWACACLGLAVGIGFVEGAFITLILVMLTLRLLTKIDIWLHAYAKIFDLYLEFPNNKSVAEFRSALKEMHVKVCNSVLSKNKSGGGGVNAIVCLEVRYRKQRPEVIEAIGKMECVEFFEEL
ncbi:MAG: MgtC/SapB family protein [Coprococcus sp.]|nr:MgtC/SapB family protein [Coprococcus sp.]